MAVARDDHAILDRIAADDPAGRHFEAEDRVAGGGKLVHQFARGRAAVEGAGVGLFQDDHAGALDARVVGFHRRRDEVGEPHVGDEAAALLHLQHGLFAFLPFGHAHLAAEHAGIDADVRDGLGEAERAAPGSCGLRRAAGGRSGSCNSRCCSGVPRSWMGESARHPARLPVAAPASTQASSKATRARARFLGPSMKPPSEGSMKTPVMPDSSKA